MHEFCISQCTEVTFIVCGGHIYCHFCEIYLGFHTPKITHIGWYFTKLFKTKRWTGLFSGYSVVNT